MRVAVFTGSSFGRSEQYTKACVALAEHLVAQDVGIVYGGAHVGLMGTLADAALRAGGDVVGVIPDTLVQAEIAHGGLTELHVVDSMHERKAKMAAAADAFVALPGGLGTLEELFEIWTWQQLGLHRKPVAVLNTGGFWDPLLDALDRMTAAGFVKPENRASLLVVDEPDGLLDAYASWQAPVGDKWSPSPATDERR
ncbi:hypothetical protein CLV30_12424 [Haloactinopolyspora alba]|uniref:Cytokinin riboside 5'-monophosphate phosphoribohydrolase n=1 Tax=Haloactinopolyspora alba TaxID=648780 RepID=A0A2P8DI88_9ACTN|nr:TIGR00730 family Rossman fold protein [Haloactinopolyspora alba]PSK96940.1 hypothetical protein CLV30_12424 [Haloactinopolyspora alba]